MKHFKVLYDNPLINVMMTFVEPLPVGLIVTLISAAILRKKRNAAPRDEGSPVSYEASKRFTEVS